MANARRRTQRPNRTASRVAARAAGTTLESEESRVSSMVDWESEMRYINKDLRDLLIITIVLFVLLFVVGFLM